MRLRKRYLPLAAAMGAAVAVIPGMAQGESPPSTGSFTASDDHWQVSGSSATSVTIAPGGTVTFSYPAGASEHDADFGAGAQPTSCTQTGGASSGAVPPLPHEPTAPGWSGSCTFNVAGTYSFHCDRHPSMVGTIHVQSTTSPTTTTTTPGGGTTTTTTTTTSTASAITSTGAASSTVFFPSAPGTVGSSSSPQSAHDSLAGSALQLSRSQHGTRVHGSLLIAQPGSRVQIELLAATASLASAKQPAGVRVGALSKAVSASGRLSFSITLSAKAKRALSHRGRLALTVKITLTPPHARKLSRTIALSVRR
jgi:plastocyanin